MSPTPLTGINLSGIRRCWLNSFPQYILVHPPHEDAADHISADRHQPQGIVMHQPALCILRDDKSADRGCDTSTQLLDRSVDAHKSPTILRVGYGRDQRLAGDDPGEYGGIHECIEHEHFPKGSNGKTAEDQHHYGAEDAAVDEHPKLPDPVAPFANERAGYDARCTGDDEDNGQQILPYTDIMHEKIAGIGHHKKAPGGKKCCRDKSADMSFLRGRAQQMGNGALSCTLPEMIVYRPHPAQDYQEQRDA